MLCSLHRGQRRTSALRASPTAIDELNSEVQAVVDEDEFVEEERAEEESTPEPAKQSSLNTFESPFAEGAQVGLETFPLTLENVEKVLDELRPYLQKDGGDCKVLELEGPILKLEMQGSCSSCSSSAITVKMGIERTMLARIPEIHEVEAIMPGAKIPDEQGVQAILDTISGLLSVSGSTVELVELDVAEDIDSTSYICVGMSGPAQRNRSVRAEVLRRIKFIYGQCNVEVIGDEDEE